MTTTPTTTLAQPPQAASTPTMRAIVQARYGTDPSAVLRLAEIARPAVGADDVLVRVVAASVDRGTVHCMTGLPYAMRLAGFGLRSPKAPNPGRALAGAIEAVGRNVTGFAPGDEVFGSCAGSFSEYARVEPAMIAMKPCSLSFEQSASMPISAGTALQAVRTASVQAGQHVLVVGASGGVGTFAVQIAKAAGAEVTGVCRTSKVELVRDLGAHRVIDYTREDFAGGDRRYDVIIDIGGHRRLRHLRCALSRNGVLVIVGGETDGRLLGGFDRSLRAALVSPFVPQSLRMLVSTENSDDLEALGRLADSGQITPVIERTYPLAETSEAIRHVSDGRARGKIVVTV